MDFKIEIDPKVVAAELSKILVSDSLKALLDKAVEYELTRLNTSTSGWNASKIINDVVREYIKIEIEKLIKEKYQEHIKEKVAELFNTEQLDNTVIDFMGRLEIKSRY